MYKVFLSSTSRDLADYREAVHRALDGMPGFQLVKMEDFGARDANAKDLCAKLVRESDLLVGLMGHYYGSCPPNETVSYTELEYRTAKDAGLPRLMFAAPDDFSSPISLRESDGSFARQQALRREVMSERVVASFDTPERLAAEVTKALFVWQEEQRRAGQTVAVGGVQEAGPTAAAPQAEKPLGPNPYRGLEAFRKEDADRFFGREALVDHLWNRFLELHAAPTDGEAPIRLLAILGASGSGKSSVAQAGLLAKLDRDPLPGRPNPRSVVFTPEARPLESLAVALARQASDELSPVKKASEFEEVLRERPGHDGLRYLTERMLDVGGGGLILLVDQFEELYSLCNDEQERAAFIENLLTAAREPRGRVSIIVTLRSDFLGAINQHPELSRLIARQNVLVPVMGEDELRRAIEEPAKRAGLEIDQSTVDLLIEQTHGREGALPALEFVLSRIWDGFRQGVSSADTVRELGGVGGALANQAQAVYESLGPEEQRIARRAFLAMVRLGEGTRDTRRRVLVDEIVSVGQSREQVLNVLGTFANPGWRLVTLGGSEAGEPTAELAHEALLDHWTRLKDWLDEGRNDLRFHRRLAAAAKHWNSHNRPEGSLWRPPDLYVLHEFRDRAGAELNAVEIAFITASSNAYTLEQSARRRRSQLAWIVSAAMMVLAIGAAALAWYAWRGAVAAEAQRRLALGRQLGVEALRGAELGYTSFDSAAKSAALALESWNLLPTAEADQAARKLLDRLPARRLELLDRVSSIAFDADARRLAVGNEDGDILVVDVQSGTALFKHELTQPVTALALAPLGSRLAMGTQTGQIVVLQVPSGDILYHTEIQQMITSLAFSSDAKLLGIGTGEVARLGTSFFPSSDSRSSGHAMLIQIDKNQVMFDIAEETPITSLAVDPAGHQLALGHGNDLSVYNIGDGSEIYADAFPGFITSLNFSPDNELLIIGTAGDGGNVISLDLRSSEKRAQLKVGQPIQDVAIDKSGARIAFGGGDPLGVASGGIAVVENDQYVYVKNLRGASIGALEFTDNRDTLAAVMLVAKGGVISSEMWLLEITPADVLYWHKFHERVQAASISKDQRTMAVALSTTHGSSGDETQSETEGRVLVFDMESGEEKYQRILGQWPSDVVLAEDGSRLAIGVYGGNVLVIDLESGQEIFHRNEEGTVVDVELNRDGSRLAFGISKYGLTTKGARARVELVELNDGSSLYAGEFGEPEAAVGMDGEGRRLVIGLGGQVTFGEKAGHEGEVVTVDIDRRRELYRLPVRFVPSAVVLSEDGEQVAVGGWRSERGVDNALLIDGRTGSVLLRREFDSGVIGVELDVELGWLLLSDGLLSYVDRESGVEVGGVDVGTDVIRFRSIGSKLIVVREDAVEILVGDPGEVMELMCSRRVGENLRMEEWRRYFGQEAWRPSCSAWGSP